MTRGLLVDLGQVVILNDWDLLVRELQKRSKHEQRKYLSVKATRDVLMSSRLIHRFDDGEFTAFEFYKQLLEFFEIDPSKFSYKEFREIWALACRTLNKPLVALLREIKTRARAPLAIASNTQELYWEYIVRNYYKEVVSLFDTYGLSYSMRVSKPDPLFWLELSLRLGIDLPALVLLDDRDENGASFARFGGHFIKYTQATHEQAEKKLRQIFDISPLPAGVDCDC